MTQADRPTPPSGPSGPSSTYPSAGLGVPPPPSVDQIAAALRDTLKYSSKQADGDNVVDGLFAIAIAVNRLAAAVEHRNSPGWW